MGQKDEKHSLTQQDIEQHLQSALAAATPNVWPKLDLRVPQDKPVKSRGIWQSAQRFRRLGAAAACVCLLVFAGVYHYEFLQVDAIVGIDVNPSLKLSLNRRERVLKAEALNLDGVQVLNKELKGKSLESAVNQVVDSLVEKGYLQEGRQEQAVLVSVSGKSERKAEKVKTAVTANMETAISQKQVSAVVYDQTIQVTKELEELAEAYQVSVGKAEFIERLVQENEAVIQDVPAAYERMMGQTIQDLSQEIDEQAYSVSPRVTIIQVEPANERDEPVKDQEKNRRKNDEESLSEKEKENVSVGEEADDGKKEEKDAEKSSEGERKDPATEITSEEENEEKTEESRKSDGNLGEQVKPEKEDLADTAEDNSDTVLSEEKEKTVVSAEETETAEEASSSTVEAKEKAEEGERKETETEPEKAETKEAKTEEETKEAKTEEETKEAESEEEEPEKAKQAETKQKEEEPEETELKEAEPKETEPEEDSRRESEKLLKTEEENAHFVNSIPSGDGDLWLLGDSGEGSNFPSSEQKDEKAEKTADKYLTEMENVSDREKKLQAEGKPLVEEGEAALLKVEEEAAEEIDKKPKAVEKQETEKEEKPKLTDQETAVKEIESAAEEIETTAKENEVGGEKPTASDPAVTNTADKPESTERSEDAHLAETDAKAKQETAENRSNTTEPDTIDDLPGAAELSTAQKTEETEPETENATTDAVKESESEKESELEKEKGKAANQIIRMKENISENLEPGDMTKKRKKGRQITSNGTMIIFEEVEKKVYQPPVYASQLLGSAQSQLLRKGPGVFGFIIADYKEEDREEEDWEENDEENTDWFWEPDGELEGEEGEWLYFGPGYPLP